jgi:hypothetical protein
MKIFLSVKDSKEARKVIAGGGCDILDVKNPSEGTLGANVPWVIQEIRDIIPGDIRLAASIGDFHFKPGTAALAARGIVTLGVNYVTVSMFGVKTPDEVGEMVKKISKAIDDYDPDVGLIICGYADCHRIGAVSPFDFVTEIGEAEILMVDTAIKDGKNLFDFVTVEVLQDLNDTAHAHCLETIFAGSIRLNHLPMALEAKPDYLGFRGVICEKGEVSRRKVDILHKELRRLEDGRV